MITTTYGYKIPETGDTGTIVFPALEDDIQQLNDHSHNGIDSVQLTAQAITGITQTIASASWVANGPTGHYRQIVSLPSGFDYDNVQIGFRLLSSGDYVFPKVEKIDDAQYYVYTVDNTQGFTAVYGG